MKNTIYCMIGAILVTFVLALFINTAMAADQMPSSEHVKMLLDNDKVKVFEAKRPPGTVVPMHSHPPFVAYFFSPCKIKHTFPDGKTKVVEPKAGRTAWKPKGMTHALEVLGDQDQHVLVIELKK